MTICHLELPSIVIHRESSEAKAQLEREKVLELSLQRRRTVFEEEPEEVERVDLRKKVRFNLNYLNINFFQF